MKSLASAVLILLATVFFTLGVFEISFPHIFSWSELLADRVEGIYRYPIHIGVAETIVAALLALAAWKLAPSLASKSFQTLFRIGLGGMFIFASYHKIQDPRAFAILIAQYQFLPHDTINFFALLLPTAELVFGLALIFTPYTRENALALLVMFGAFMVALASALYRDLGITCGCFAIEGAQDKTEAWIALIRDIVLLGPTIWLTQVKNQSLLSLWTSSGNTYRDYR